MPDRPQKMKPVPVTDAISKGLTHRVINNTIHEKEAKMPTVSRALPKQRGIDVPPDVRINRQVVKLSVVLHMEGAQCL